RWRSTWRSAPRRCRPCSAGGPPTARTGVPAVSRARAPRPPLSSSVGPATRPTGGRRARMPSPHPVTVVVVALLVAVLVASLKVVREYERLVVFRLGRLRGALGPGLVLMLPFFDRSVRVDQRVVTLTIPPQEVITRDNVTARVNAVVMFKVCDPVRSVMAVENHAVATSQFAQTTLRSVVGRADLDTLLAHRADLNEDLYRSIAQQAVPWGVDVDVVEIKDVEIPEMMQRAMARQAEAERERRAKVISAHGEL